MVATRSHVLTLYKRILTLHRHKLTSHMRVLGDQYVRDEFKRHKSAESKFVPLFLREWDEYATVLDRKKDRFGQHLSTQDQELLDGEQKMTLQSLQDAAKKVGETIV